MAYIEGINPNRIKWCCADRGVMLEECAAKIDVSVEKLEKAIKGELSLTYNQLSALAKYFGRGVLFFLDKGDVDEKQMHSPQFRTLTNQKPQLSPQIKALIERVEQQRSIYLSLREDIDGEEISRFHPPKLTDSDIDTATQEVRKWLGLGTQNLSFDTYRQHIEAKGILVFCSNGYNGKWQIAKENPIAGFSLYDPKCPVIFIKKSFSKARQSFTLMHELGHLLLHKTSFIDDHDDLHLYAGAEREANIFAGKILVPDKFLSFINDADKPAEASEYDQWLQAHCKRLGVSAEVILIRLLDHRRLSRRDYDSYRDYKKSIAEDMKDKEAGGSRLYRPREPKHIFGDGFVHTVLDALNARHITLAKASSYLDNIKIHDLHQLEKYYAGV